ncbi:MAG TPA: transposase [Candidatus Udaeobacter sp.]|nr:transposase [Candidatus Udaeobacter sp.]
MTRGERKPPTLGRGKRAVNPVKTVIAVRSQLMYVMQHGLRTNQHLPQQTAKGGVAGDFGIVRRVTFSDDVVVPPIDVSWEEHRKKFYQRRLRNKRKFSQSWKKIVSKISKLDRRIANIRKDETHKFTSAYSKNHAVIVLGDLDIKSMSASAAGSTEKPGKRVKQKSGLNRALLRQGWGELGRQLEYKQLWQGGLVEYQSEAFSSQDCPKCSYRSPGNRKTQDRFAIAVFQRMRMR